MAYCTTKAILDKALTKCQDTSDEFRVLALGWLNETIRDVLNQPRIWNFLGETVSLAVTANKITLPAGAAEIVYLKTANFFFTPSDQLTDLEVAEIGDDTGTDPVGYTLNADNEVEFHPGLTGTVELKYEAELTADLTDGVTATIFPKSFENVFISGVRTHAYDYEKDGRYTKEMMVYADEMRKVKASDNRRKPLPQFNRHGYMRTK